jgi:AcrR family transcriptional regulator
MKSTLKKIPDKKLATSTVRLLKPVAKSGSQGTGKPGRGKSRLEKSELIHEALLKAAAEVVGEVGYANASIALITQQAGVGQGTFYNYFSSRQEILDELLPNLGANMTAHIRKYALGGHSFAELEDRSFRGFFSFLRETPQFLRILNGAEMFAEAGYRKHFENVAKKYTRFLQHSLQEGDFPGYKAEELEVIVFMLMAARSYLAMRYVLGAGEQSALPEMVAQTYMKFVRYGLEGAPRSATGASVKKSKKTS